MLGTILTIPTSYKLAMFMADIKGKLRVFEQISIFDFHMRQQISKPIASGSRQFRVLDTEHG